MYVSKVTRVTSLSRSNSNTAEDCNIGHKKYDAQKEECALMVHIH